MNLTGRSIGNYQIMEELGRGGMAVVYRAYQPSLNRYVAIKVLPPQLSFDQEFIQRFQREARAAAGLRHPNIVVIHDVGEAQGVGGVGDTHYIVMEYLEGRTLKDLIQREGSLHPRRVAHIVEQIAAALDYAHQRGFVHRDVKPANIFVGQGDRVTLTDFGIAKAASETQHLTRTGTLMGTPEYMSPEQAEGGVVDHRTDLYALGVVLYQMLVGRVPFRGTTPHAVLHDVIYEAPPPPRQINPNLSPALEAVILKAIAKDPRQRFQRGADLVKALQQAIERPQAGAAAPPPRPPRAAAAPARREPRSPVIWILGGIAVVLVVVVGLLLLLLGGGGGGEPTATGVALEPTATDTTAPPTATQEAAVTAAPPAPSATVASPESPTLVPVDTPTATFTSAPQATETSPPPTATEEPPTSTPAPTEASAARFGRLAFSSNRDGNPEIYVVNLAGGQPQRLTNNAANDWLPDWSPDGGRIAFTSHRTGSYDLWVMNADGGGQSAWVTTSAWDDYARWAPDGQRLSFSSTARTQGVDNSEIFVRQASGQLTQVTHSTAEDQWADWSSSGRLVYTEGFQDSSDWDIHLVNADGSNHSLWLDQPSCDVQPTWSPDDQWIAFLRISSDTDGDGSIDFEDAGDIWIGRASGGGLRQLTSGLWASTPAWSPDGQWIAFARVRDSNNNGRSDENDRVDILAVPLNGGDVVPLVTGPSRDGNPSWTW